MWPDPFGVGHWECQKWLSRLKNDLGILLWECPHQRSWWGKVLCFWETRVSPNFIIQPLCSLERAETWVQTKEIPQCLELFRPWVSSSLISLLRKSHLDFPYSLKASTWAGSLLLNNLFSFLKLAVLPLDQFFMLNSNHKLKTSHKIVC